MLEAAVRAAFSKPAATFPAAAAASTWASEPAAAPAAADGCKKLLDAALKLCALALLGNVEDAHDVRLALLIDSEEADNRSMLHAVQQAMQSASSSAGSAAAVAAAAKAAAEAGARIAQQERLQLLLRVVSLLGSCVKAMARDQQQQQRALSWGQVALRCGRIAELCLELAGYEQALVEQRVKSTEIEADKIIAMLDRWCAAEDVSRLSDASVDIVAEMLVQHPYTRQLVWTNLGSLHSLLQQCVETPTLAADQDAGGAGVVDRDAAARAAAEAAAAAALAEPLASPEHVLLAALLWDTLSDQPQGCVSDAAPGTEVCGVTGISDKRQAASADVCLGGHSCSSGSSSGSSSSSMLTTLDLKLACMAVAARAMGLYCTVLEAALSHPCLKESSSAEERSVGAAQLAQQLDRLDASGAVVLLPAFIQQQMLQSGRQQCLETLPGAAAAIGALLGSVQRDLHRAKMCVRWVRQQLSDLKQAQSTRVAAGAAKDAVERDPAPAPIQVFKDAHALLRDAQLAEAQVISAEVVWRQMQEVVCQMRPARLSNGSGEVEQLTADETAAITAMWVQEEARLSRLGGRDSSKRHLAHTLQVWAGELAAALPSRRCCSNPCCVSLREMSEWQMVGGRGCVCGGCAAGSGQAVRYCSRECQTAHWPAHKSVCRSLRRRQQQQ
jgi:hypothetical protein